MPGPVTDLSRADTHQAERIAAWPPPVNSQSRTKMHQEEPTTACHHQSTSNHGQRRTSRDGRGLARHGQRTTRALYLQLIVNVPSCGQLPPPYLKTRKNRRCGSNNSSSNPTALLSNTSHSRASCFKSAARQRRHGNLGFKPHQKQRLHTSKEGALNARHTIISGPAMGVSRAIKLFNLSQVSRTFPRNYWQRRPSAPSPKV